jgi:hypothetical protein
MIPPFEHPHVIAGQGTLGLEMLEQVPDLDTVLVQLVAWFPASRSRSSCKNPMCVSSLFRWNAAARCTPPSKPASRSR